MKRVFIILAVVLIAGSAQAQIYNIGIFGTDAAQANLDTLASADSVLTSRDINWSTGWKAMLGSFRAYGYVKKLAGDNQTMTVSFLPLLDTDFFSPDTITLGTIALTDSTAFDYDVSGESAWGLCQGGKFIFTFPLSGTQAKIYGRYKAK